jgi:CheY-like chemotaxis protein
MPTAFAEDRVISARDKSKRSNFGSHKSHGRVLVVDDSSDGRWMISSILGNLGMEVDAVANARVACDMAVSAWKRGEPFALILMDSHMPEMDGYQAAARLRSRRYPGRIVVLTSTSSFGLSDDRWRDAGCDGYATKPITFEMLQQVVRRYL